MCSCLQLQVSTENKICVCEKCKDVPVPGTYISPKKKVKTMAGCSVAGRKSVSGAPLNVRRKQKHWKLMVLKIFKIGEKRRIFSITLVPKIFFKVFNAFPNDFWIPTQFKIFRQWHRGSEYSNFGYSRSAYSLSHNYSKMIKHVEHGHRKLCEKKNRRYKLSNSFSSRGTNTYRI